MRQLKYTSDKHIYIENLSNNTFLPNKMKYLDHPDIMFDVENYIIYDHKSFKSFETNYETLFNTIIKLIYYTDNRLLIN